MNQKELEELAMAYALKNALAYGGKSQVGSVISGLFNEGLKKDDIKNFSKKILEIVNEVNKLSLFEQEKEFKNLEKLTSHRKVREGLSDLPGAKKGKVIMRFAPSPSGALHVGHALTACLSYDYVQKYGGKFIFRIEDTNPENIYEPAYELLTKDAEWLFNGDAGIIIQSDRMKKYYSYAEKLIKKNSCYVCICSGDKFREFVQEKKNCSCRKLSSKENLERWKKMLDKNGFKEGGAVLRFKSSMSHKNPAMRDFPLARINETKHPRQKNKYRVWPLMNLAVSVDDIEMKMTHIIRAKEHRDNSERQKMIFKALGKKFPWVGFLGRIHLKDMKLSSTEITQGIKDGKYSGWDDPKLMTISSLEKQGYHPIAFWKFAEHIGLSENDKILDKKDFFELLDTFNKKESKI